MDLGKPVLRAELEGGAWTQLGAALTGTSRKDHFGHALALSAVRGGKMVKPPTTPRASPTTSPSVSRSADPSSPAHQGPRRVQPYATR